MNALELNKLLDRTAELIRKQKVLKAEEDSLREIIQKELETSDISTLSTQKVTVTLVSKKSYVYSIKVQEWEKELKQMKTQEEKYDVAKLTMKSHYMYSLNKDYVKDEYDNFGDILNH